MTVPIGSFEELRDLLLAPDPTRAEQFGQFEPLLRERFRPGDYPIPMRADLLRLTSR